MSPVKHDSQPRANSFPRVSGDEPPRGKGNVVDRWFSPRERG